MPYETEEQFKARIEKQYAALHTPEAKARLKRVPLFGTKIKVKEVRVYFNSVAFADVVAGGFEITLPVEKLIDECEHT